MATVTFTPATTGTTPGTILTLDQTDGHRVLTALGYPGTGSAAAQQVLDRITTALEADSGHVELYLLRRVAQDCHTQGVALTWG